MRDIEDSKGPFFNAHLLAWPKPSPGRPYPVPNVSQRLLVGSTGTLFLGTGIYFSSLGIFREEEREKHKGEERERPINRYKGRKQEPARVS